MLIKTLLLISTTFYQKIACWLEDRNPVPGKLINIGEYSLHYWEESAHQVSVANDLGIVPIVSIKANSFFKPSFWTMFIPLKKANQLREKMHIELGKLSTDFRQIEANQSGHFVWIDQLLVIIEAVKTILDKIKYSN